MVSTPALFGPGFGNTALSGNDNPRGRKSSYLRGRAIDGAVQFTCQSAEVTVIVPTLQRGNAARDAPASRFTRVAGSGDSFLVTVAPAFRFGPVRVSLFYRPGGKRAAYQVQLGNEKRPPPSKCRGAAFFEGAGNLLLRQFGDLIFFSQRVRQLCVPGFFPIATFGNRLIKAERLFLALPGSR